MFRWHQFLLFHSETTFITNMQVNLSHLIKCLLSFKVISGVARLKLLSVIFFLFQIALALVVLVAAVSADNPAPRYEPVYRPAYPQPSYKEPKYEEPAKYEYNYAVQDEYKNVDFDANEARDGYATNGGYRVVLPDGRTQIVSYTVSDGYSGYVADVQYEGEAKYEEPAYKPYQPKYEPVYKPYQA